MSDRPYQRGKRWLEQFLLLANFKTGVKDLANSAVATSEAPEQPANYWLTIDEAKLTPAQVAALIGTEGGTLDAIQYLANASLNLSQEPEDQAFYTVELNGYRLRRQEELQAIAQLAAEQARSSGQEVEIKSLSSAERRQVHSFFQDCEDIETYSRGQEPDRRLVVRLR